MQPQPVLQYQFRKITADDKRRAVASALTLIRPSLRITPGQRAAILRSRKGR